MRRRLVFAAVVMAVLASVGAGALTLQASSASSAPEPVSPTIKHVVIIYQENHSFDDVLGKLCASFKGRNAVHSACDGATSGQVSDGSTVQLTREPDKVPHIDHGSKAQGWAIDGGKMDGFDKIFGCSQTGGYKCYSQYDPSQIPNLSSLATNFALSDRTFEFGLSPTWVSHLILAAATLDGFVGDGPRHIKHEASPSASGDDDDAGPASIDAGWGCDSKKDAKWWNGSKIVYEPSCIPDANGNGPYRQSPVQYVPTIFDRMDQASLSWKVYTGLGWGGQGYAARSARRSTSASARASTTTWWRRPRWSTMPTRERCRLSRW